MILFCKVCCSTFSKIFRSLTYSTVFNQILCLLSDLDISTVHSFLGMISLTVVLCNPLRRWSTVIGLSSSPVFLTIFWQTFFFYYVLFRKNDRPYFKNRQIAIIFIHMVKHFPVYILWVSWTIKCRHCQSLQFFEYFMLKF